MKLHKIETPRGTLEQVQRKNGIQAKLTWNEEFAKNRSAGFNRIQRFIDGEVLRRCAPYIPKETGLLIRSGILMTVVGSGEVIYQTPYARRRYYQPAKFHEAPMRGNYWFERMKNSGGKEAILEGAKKMAGAK